jgi:hypothetical protein
VAGVPDALWATAGVLVLVTVAWDIFVTVLHHWGGLGPLGGPFVHGGWRVMVRLIRRLSARRHRLVLGYAGPALIPFTLLLWAGFVVLGFGMVYVSLMPEGFHSSTEGAPRGVGDALWFSGVTFCTLGYGDIVPVGRGARVVALLEGISGLAMVSLAISYFASVYTAYSSQKALAETLYAQAGESADAARVIANHLAGGPGQTLLAMELARLRDGMAALSAAYTTLPILHFFVAAQPRESLLRLLFVVHELATLLDTAIDPVACPAVAGLGRRSGLEATGRNLRLSLGSTLMLGLDRAAGQARGERRETRAAELSHRFEQARSVLGAAGVAVCQGDAARAAYVAARLEWEPWLRASSEVLGEPWEDVVSGC